MAESRKKTIKVDTRKTYFKVEDGEVVKIDPPPIEVEEPEEEAGTVELPKYRIQTEKGEAVYEYSGECKDCADQGITTPIFHCITEIRADAEIGDQLAAGWNDGGFATPLCQKHYHIRNRKIARVDPGYKVIEKTW